MVLRILWFNDPRGCREQTDSLFNEPPFSVTGNSAKMKEIVQKVVDKYEYFCYAESVHNQGSVIVTEKEW